MSQTELQENQNNDLAIWEHVKRFSVDEAKGELHFYCKDKRSLKKLFYDVHLYVGSCNELVFKKLILEYKNKVKRSGHDGIKIFCIVGRLIGIKSPLISIGEFY